MNRFGCFLFGLLFGAALMWGTLHYHFVRADQGLHAVPKMIPAFADSYVDIRGFGFEQWNQHHALAVAIQQAGKAELLKGVVPAPFQGTAEDFLRSMNQP